uniref:Uncharacterized protein n=1 Tax=Trichuris muris TaxID=70415 RepID=A0A5S6QWL5_TRIMR
MEYVNEGVFRRHKGFRDAVKPEVMLADASQCFRDQQRAYTYFLRVLLAGYLEMTIELVVFMQHVEQVASVTHGNQCRRLLVERLKCKQFNWAKAVNDRSVGK